MDSVNESRLHWLFPLWTYRDVEVPRLPVPLLSRVFPELSQRRLCVIFCTAEQVSWLVLLSKLSVLSCNMYVCVCVCVCSLNIFVTCRWFSNYSQYFSNFPVNRATAMHNVVRWKVCRFWPQSDWRDWAVSAHNVANTLIMSFVLRYPAKPDLKSFSIVRVSFSIFPTRNPLNFLPFFKLQHTFRRHDIAYLCWKCH